MVDNGLIITLSGIISGVIFLMLRLCFKSKCSDVSICFGLFRIKRDVATEKEIENEEIRAHINDTTGVNTIV